MIIRRKSFPEKRWKFFSGHKLVVCLVVVPAALVTALATAFVTPGASWGASWGATPGATWGATLGAEVTAFVGVTVIPMDQERVLDDQTVVVRNGRIVVMGERNAVLVPENATRVSGQGRYLLPGLSDMHAHLTTSVQVVGDSYGAISSHTSTEVARSQLLLYLATGVTTLRNTAGSEAHQALAQSLAAGTILGPRMYTSSPLVEGENAVWAWASVVTDPAEAASLVADFADQGYTMVKVYHTVSAEVYRAISAAAAAHDMQVIGHVSFDVGIDLALEAGQHSIEHLRGYDFDGASPEALAKDGGRSAERFATWLSMTPARRNELAWMTFAAGTFNCPTLVISELLFDDVARSALKAHPNMRYVHPQVRASVASNVLDEIFGADAKAMMKTVLPQQYEMIAALNEAGAGLLTGTDTMVPYLIPGFTVIEEMAHFVAAGLSPFDALRASTASAVESLGLLAESGTINVGKRADMLLLDANPLEDINNLWRLAGVMIDGRWIDQTEMAKLLEELAASYP